MYDVGWVQLINPEPVEVDANRLVLAHTPKEVHLNHNGDVAAGVIFSMVEMAGVGVLVVAAGEAADDAFVVVKDCHLAFTRRARGRIRAVATRPEPAGTRDDASILASGGSLEEVVPVQVLDEADQVVAEATVTGVIRRKRSEADIVADAVETTDR